MADKKEALPTVVQYQYFSFATSLHRVAPWLSTASLIGSLAVLAVTIVRGSRTPEQELPSFSVLRVTLSMNVDNDVLETQKASLQTAFVDAIEEAAEEQSVGQQLLILGQDEADDDETVRKSRLILMLYAGSEAAAQVLKTAAEATVTNSFVKNELKALDIDRNGQNNFDVQFGLETVEGGVVSPSGSVWQSVFDQGVALLLGASLLLSLVRFAGRTPQANVDKRALVRGFQPWTSWTAGFSTLALVAANAMALTNTFEPQPGVHAKWNAFMYFSLVAELACLISAHYALVPVRTTDEGNDAKHLLKLTPRREYWFFVAVCNLAVTGLCARVLIQVIEANDGSNVAKASLVTSAVGVLAIFLALPPATFALTGKPQLLVFLSTAALTGSLSFFDGLLATDDTAVVLSTVATAIQAVAALLALNAEGNGFDRVPWSVVQFPSEVCKDVDALDGVRIVKDVIKDDGDKKFSKLQALLEKNSAATKAVMELGKTERTTVANLRAELAAERKAKGDAEAAKEKIEREKIAADAELETQKRAKEAAEKQAKDAELKAENDIKEARAQNEKARAEQLLQEKWENAIAAMEAAAYARFDQPTELPDGKGLEAKWLAEFAAAVNEFLEALKEGAATPKSLKELKAAWENPKDKPAELKDKEFFPALEKPASELIKVLILNKSAKAQKMIDVCTEYLKPETKVELESFIKNVKTSTGSAEGQANLLKLNEYKNQIKSDDFTVSDEIQSILKNDGDDVFKQYLIRHVAEEFNRRVEKAFNLDEFRKARASSAEAKFEAEYTAKFGKLAETLGDMLLALRAALPGKEDMIRTAFEAPIATLFDRTMSMDDTMAKEKTAEEAKVAAEAARAEARQGVEEAAAAEARAAAAAEALKQAQAEADAGAEGATEALQAAKAEAKAAQEEAAATRVALEFVRRQAKEANTRHEAALAAAAADAEQNAKQAAAKLKNAQEEKEKANEKLFETSKLLAELKAQLESQPDDEAVRKELLDAQTQAQKAETDATAVRTQLQTLTTDLEAAKTAAAAAQELVQTVRAQNAAASEAARAEARAEARAAEAALSEEISEAEQRAATASEQAQRLEDTLEEAAAKAELAASAVTAEREAAEAAREAAGEAEQRAQTDMEALAGELGKAEETAAAASKQAQRLQEAAAKVAAAEAERAAEAEARKVNEGLATPAAAQKELQLPSSPGGPNVSEAYDSVIFVSPQGIRTNTEHPVTIQNFAHFLWQVAAASMGKEQKQEVQIEEIDRALVPIKTKLAGELQQQETDEIERNEFEKILASPTVNDEAVRVALHLTGTKSDAFESVDESPLAQLVTSQKLKITDPQFTLALETDSKPENQNPLYHLSPSNPLVVDLNSKPKFSQLTKGQFTKYCMALAATRANVITLGEELPTIEKSDKGVAEHNVENPDKQVTPLKDIISDMNDAFKASQRGNLQTNQMDEEEFKTARTLVQPTLDKATRTLKALVGRKRNRFAMSNESSSQLELSEQASKMQRTVRKIDFEEEE